MPAESGISIGRCPKPADHTHHQSALPSVPTGGFTGIVTASDLSGQFLQLAEPFLLLGEIENLIRRILLNKFAKQDFEAVRDPEDGHRQVSTVSDLTFGEYIRLLENGDRWQKLSGLLSSENWIWSE